jgi:hypothetical protein
MFVHRATCKAIRSRKLVGLLVAVGVLALAGPAWAAGEIRFSGSFGSAGSANGQFKEPSGVAVDEASGDVYVVDKGNNRVEYFSSTGTFEHQFNGTEIDRAPAGAGSQAPAKFSAPEAIAIDNDSTSPSYGDVYVTDTGHEVIDKFSPNGSYIGQLTGPGSDTFSGRLGVVVDSKGDVWVNEEAAIDEFSGDLGLLKEFATSFKMSPGIALDAADRVYVLTAEHNAKQLEEGGGGIHPLIEPQGCDCDTALALDRSTGGLYVDETTRLAEYSPAGALIEQFGVGELGSGAGVAINAATGALYAVDGASDVVRSTSSPTRVSVEACAGGGGVQPVDGGDELCALINPHGTTVEACKLEFGTQAASFTNEAACETTGLSGVQPVEVHARLTGLEPGKTYYYRFSATNTNGTEFGPEEQFTTEVVEPTVISQTASNVTENDATLEAQINPGGEAGYYFEYGTSACEADTCGTRTSEGFLIGDSGEAGSVEVTGLKPNTTYHYWVLAENAAAPGAVHGEAMQFTTPRAFEEIRNEEIELDIKQRAEAEARATAEAEARTAVAVKENREEETAAAQKKKEAETAAGRSLSLTIAKVKVGAGSVTVTLAASQAGTVTISGPGLKTTTKSVAAGAVQVEVVLTEAGKRDRKHHKKIKITARLKTAGRIVSGSKTVRL